MFLGIDASGKFEMTEAFQPSALAAAPPDQWLYDGPEPPRRFPGEDLGSGEQWSLEARNW